MSRTPIKEADIREKLFYAMRADMETMSEYGDNENALLAEVMTVDDEILQIYIDTFLN